MIYKLSYEGVLNKKKEISKNLGIKYDLRTKLEIYQDEDQCVIRKGAI